MRRLFLSALSFCLILNMSFLLSANTLCAQDIDKIINPSAVESIEKVLSADSMRGRATFTPDIDRAARFIEAQFRGLKSWNNSNSFLQPFSRIYAKTTTVTGQFEDATLPGSTIIVASAEPHFEISEKNGYEKAFIRAGSDISREFYKYLQQDKNLLVLMDTSYSGEFQQLKESLEGSPVNAGQNIVFVFTSLDPARYHIRAEQEIKEQRLANVVGLLPGKSKAKEYVVFSAHYDHLGVGEPDSRGDSIYNGANDDASGCTAVIMLARYFAKMHNNERTLVFATFTAEEIGGFGSKYFSHQFDPAAVMAMFNIEMIGTESKWGTNSAYITGYERTNMGKILENNLKGSGFTFHPDPYPDQQLFFRSDNATLARQGVPAHTISTSKMDSEKYYHTQGDEIRTLDMQNMARIIKAIAISSRTIIAGGDTPSRVDVSSLR